MPGTTSVGAVGIHGNYLFKIAGSESSPPMAAKTEQLLEVVAELPTAPGGGSEIFALLTGPLALPLDRIAYQKQDVFQFDFLGDVWFGSPETAGEARVFVHRAESAEGARASALKMAYAGWTKGSHALLLAINALADRSGVLDALREEWDLSQPALRERSERAATGTGPKAWRFEGEMAEIAATMAAAGLPDGFHRGAEEVYGAMAGLKDHPGPTLDEVLDRLAAGDPAAQ